MIEFLVLLRIVHILNPLLRWVAGSFRIRNRDIRDLWRLIEIEIVNREGHIRLNEGPTSQLLGSPS
jgi:hypothetical protein